MIVGTGVGASLGMEVSSEVGAISTSGCVAVGGGSVLGGEEGAASSDESRPAISDPAINIAKKTWPIRVDETGIDLQGWVASPR